MPGVQPLQFDASLVVAFVRSIKNVLSTMVSIEATVGKPYIKEGEKPGHDVSSIVGFSGEVKGNVVVSFGMDTALKVVETFCGMPLDATSDDFADAVGELCNMIAGNAKKDFGLNAGIGIPSVVIGSNHTIARLRDVPCIVIPCTCSAGDFCVEVNIKQIGNN
ncbi:MAG: chemotaxis protein CheX [Sedimentisphaerales bacterium]|nr:chemotaxis protein CheX [Sedimentisphaerales bacterium]